MSKIIKKQEFYIPLIKINNILPEELTISKPLQSFLVLTHHPLDCDSLDPSIDIPEHFSLDIYSKLFHTGFDINKKWKPITSFNKAYEKIKNLDYSINYHNKSYMNSTKDFEYFPNLGKLEFVLYKSHKQ